MYLLDNIMVSSVEVHRLSCFKLTRVVSRVILILPRPKFHSFNTSLGKSMLESLPPGMISLLLASAVKNTYSAMLLQWPCLL